MNQKTLKILLMGAAIFILVVSFIGGLWYVLSILLEPVVTAGDGFMTALKEEEFHQAYNLCTPELQAVLGNSPRLRTEILEQKLQPYQWRWRNRSLEGNRGYLSGWVTFADGRDGEVSLSLLEIDGEWRVGGFELEPE